MYRGEDIIQDIEITDEIGNLVNLDLYADVVCMIYTQGTDSEVRFSATEREGFELLIKLSDTKYRAVVSSEKSAVMALGDVMSAGRLIKTEGELPDGMADTSWIIKIADLLDHPLKTLSNGTV